MASHEKILRRKSIVPRHARKKQDMQKSVGVGMSVNAKVEHVCTAEVPLAECWSARRHEVVLPLVPLFCISQAAEIKKERKK